MRIGAVATAAGVSVDTVRYYEQRGLLPAPGRRSATAFHPGYRDYPPDVVARVRFVRQGQMLGFSLREIAELIELRFESGQSCGPVMDRAATKLAEVEARIADLESMRRALVELLEVCERDEPSEACGFFERFQASL
jgi:MerR family mercuric resistance operon transcriptional regulator